MASEEKNQTSITVAKITTAGAIIAAIIGFLGVLITSSTKDNNPSNDLTSPEPVVTTPSPTVLESAFTWLGEPISEKDFYSTGDGEYSFSPDTGLDVTGMYANDRVWINKTLPENFSASVSFTILEECLMYVGFGDGQNVKNSYAWYLYHDTAYFIKNIGDDFTFISDDIKYIATNQISTYIFERLDDSIILKSNDGQVIFRTKPVDNPEWLDINELSVFWVYAGGPQECTIRYNSIKIDESR